MLKTASPPPARARVWLVAGLVVLAGGIALASYIVRDRFADLPSRPNVAAEPELKARTPNPVAAAATAPATNLPQQVTVADPQRVETPASGQPAADQPSETPSRAQPTRVAPTPTPARRGERFGERSPGRQRINAANESAGDAAPDTEAPEYVRVSPAELSVIQKRAALGRPVAMNRLGVAYREGLGVERNYAQAAKWFRDAAEVGYPPAMQNLATLYRDGKGVPRSDVEAIAWYRKAAAKGNPQAINAMGFMTMKGRGLPADDTAAVEWFRLGAQRGEKAAMFNLAFMLEHGRGAAKDPATAEQWYRRAAELGDQRARERLARR
jgi:TPR repeat protein